MNIPFPPAISSTRSPLSTVTLMSFFISQRFSLQFAFASTASSISRSRRHLSLSDWWCWWVLSWCSYKEHYFLPSSWTNISDGCWKAPAPNAGNLHWTKYSNSHQGITHSFSILSIIYHCAQDMGCVCNWAKGWRIAPRGRTIDPDKKQTQIPWQIADEENQPFLLLRLEKEILPTTGTRCVFCDPVCVVLMV